MFGDDKIMKNQDYLIHYGVQGMRWGHRKDPGYSYTSRLTRSLQRKSEKASRKASDYKRSGKIDKANKFKQKAKTYGGRAVASQKWDDRFYDEYWNASKGRRFTTALLGGSTGRLYVSSMKASGLSTGKAYTMALLTGAVGAARYRSRRINAEGKQYEKK